LQQNLGIKEQHLRWFCSRHWRESGMHSTAVLNDLACQGKVEMSPSRQNRNVPFSLDLGGVHVNLRVPVKRRRAMLASNPIKE
jgi:hypothetical protein